MKNVAIIGSGPAGLTSAIYLSRANIKVRVFLGQLAGGQLTQTTEIENFPGFIDGINGGELMSNMMKQSQRFGAELVHATVNSLQIDVNKFVINYNENDVEIFDAVIMATGSTPKLLGINGEKELFGNGVHTCATCDGFFYKGKDVAVVGGGDTAMEEASYLSHLCNKVYIIHRSENFKASKIMVDRCKTISNIEFLTNHAINEYVVVNGDLKGIDLRRTDCFDFVHIPNILNINAVFIAIGHTPNSQLLKGIITQDEFGYLVPKYRTMSEISGIFIAGDVGDNYYRQAITAAGDGCKAAIDCERWFNTQ
jgi:thioredoxin reductase (NADPH)